MSAQPGVQAYVFDNRPEHPTANNYMMQIRRRADCLTEGIQKKQRILLVIQAAHKHKDTSR